jgi:hypothetical protein
MPGRKLLYLLRTSADVAQGDLLLPKSTTSSPQDDISVVLLDPSAGAAATIPGKTYVLQDESRATPPPSGMSMLSYADLLTLIFEADSTIVL